LMRLKEATDLPVIASGGIASLDDLKQVARLHPQGVEGAIVGRAFYENKFDVKDAILAADAASSGRDEEPLIER
jgi:phosphoribosylformimino-5-aminoimidazole carboxamide ribonucleotide (ProFAR) isomerase